MCTEIPAPVPVGVYFGGSRIHFFGIRDVDYARHITCIMKLVSSTKKSSGAEIYTLCFGSRTLLNLSHKDSMTTQRARPQKSGSPRRGVSKHQRYCDTLHCSEVQAPVASIGLPHGARHLQRDSQCEDGRSVRAESKKTWPEERGGT